MSERPMKRVADSRAEQAHVLAMPDINGRQRLFGGRLVGWIDEVSTVVARRHSGCHVTTLLIDRLEFKAAAHAGDAVIVSGRLTYVGNSSMEVSVDTFREELNGERILINKARLIMVALDENERPTPVPGLILETDEERQAWADALARRAAVSPSKS